MSVLLIDADGELWYTRQEELGVDCIKMPYAYNNETYYYDLGKNTDFRRFYDAVRGGTVPTTMALNPQEYVEILEPYFQKGEDVLYVSFSHAMSGTFDHLQTALKQLKEKYPQRKCTVFDTKSISLGAGIQMEYAAQLKNSGATDEEIISALEKFTDRVAVYFVVDDLNHLKRGGRTFRLCRICRHAAANKAHTFHGRQRRIVRAAKGDGQKAGVAHHSRQGGGGAYRYGIQRVHRGRRRSVRRRRAGKPDKGKTSGSKNSASGGRSRHRSALRPPAR